SPISTAASNSWNVRTRGSYRNGYCTGVISLHSRSCQSCPRSKRASSSRASSRTRSDDMVDVTDKANKYRSVGYYPGCALEGTGNGYDVSTRAIAKKLGLGLREVSN